MLSRSFAALAACAFVLTGCAAPLVQPHMPTWQPKVEHAKHWQAMADHAVARFGLTQKTSTLPRIYVAPGPSDMPFAQIYRKYLEQAFIERGYPVSETAWDSVTVNFDVQTFLYGAGNEKRLVDYWSLSTTAYGIGSQLRHISSYDTAVFAGVLTGPVLDFLASVNDTTNAEVTVTTTVTDPTNLHYIDTQTSYVQPKDLVFYLTRQPAAAPQSLPVREAPTVTLPIRSDYR